MKRVNSHLYRRLLTYVKPYYVRLIWALLLAVAVSLSTGAAAWVVKPVLDDVFLRKDPFMLKVLPLFLLAVYFVKGVSRYGQSYMMRYVGQRVIMKLRQELFEHIQLMSLDFFHTNPSATLMARITNDVNLLARVSSVVLADFFRQIFTMITLLALMFYREWFLALISVVVLPFLSIPLVKIGKKIKQISTRSQEKMGDLNVMLQEAFTGTKIVKIFGMEKEVNKKFERENKKLYDITMKSVRAEEVTSPLMEFLGAIGTAIVIWYGGYQVLKGITSPGSFFSFLTAAMMLYTPLRKLSKMYTTYNQSMAAAERVFDLLDCKPGIIDSKKAIHMAPFRSAIEFENVEFRYNSRSEMILKDINLIVPRGEIVAIVGQSGAGKTTLVDLIPRLYEVSGGCIRIDGVDIRNISVQSLRENIGVVTQETILFNDSVKNNIHFGNIKASDEDVIEAAKLAYAHDFIVNLPDGYESLIGERGDLLSGGQKQRIAIARAILKDPSILILDEATSELDSESEQLVQKALENLMKGRTTFVIAHRLSTVRNADTIVVIEDGTIQESGSHDQLYRKKGFYYRLYTMQFSENTTVN